MENPADYDIDKDMGDEEVDETKIGNIIMKFNSIAIYYKLLNYAKIFLNTQRYFLKLSRKLHEEYKNLSDK